MKDSKKEDARCEHLKAKIEVGVWVLGYWESVEETEILKSVLDYADRVIKDFRAEHPNLTVERIVVNLGVGHWRIFTKDGLELEGP
jgi:hypothetical protein